MQDTGNEAGIPTIGQMIAELERSALDVSRLEFEICTFGNPWRFCELDWMWGMNTTSIDIVYNLLTQLIDRRDLIQPIFNINQWKF